MKSRLLSIIVLLSSTYQACNAQITARERLGMAIEYFQSGKYHESLLIFERLDKEYELDIRYKAYIGVCRYYEYDY